jgi:hypothetical protein
MINPVANLAAVNRAKLEAGPNIVLRGRPDEGYYVGIDLAKMEAKRAKHGANFNIVVFGDPADPHDYYVMPFSAIGSLFAATPSQLRSTERPRWKVQIHSDGLTVAGIDKRLNVAEFYADFAATQPGDLVPGNCEVSDATELDTERTGVVTQRKGQDRFQLDVLSNFEHKCCLIGVVERESCWWPATLFLGRGVCLRGWIRQTASACLLRTTSCSTRAISRSPMI